MGELPSESQSAVAELEAVTADEVVDEDKTPGDATADNPCEEKDLSVESEDDQEKIELTVTIKQAYDIVRHHPSDSIATTVFDQLQK